MASPAAAGSVIRMAVPLLSVLDASMLPPWAVTIPCTTASPSPVPMPAGLVVKNGSKTRSSVAASIPLPVSLTVRQMPGCAAPGVVSRVTSMASTPPPSRMACAALLPRFIST